MQYPIRAHLSLCIGLEELLPQTGPKTWSQTATMILNFKVDFQFQLQLQRSVNY